MVDGRELVVDERVRGGIKVIVTRACLAEALLENVNW
jgi:hypothetical protein